MPVKNYKTIKLDPKYMPKKTEPYMSPEQKAYFYNLLNAQRQELLSDAPDILNDILLGEKMDSAGPGDDLDVSSFRQEANEKIKINERASRLLRKIENALKMLEAGTYGYSVISGEPIGLKRLLVRPVATMTIEEQEEYEKKKM
ncbi:MAG: TraR/DksA family transcriptional regulator [Proteobacteria bacterium]|nr:TraR/DksA family transcriptional regulator [Pseudomonadota bacterium]